MLGCESTEDKPTATGAPEAFQDLSTEDAKAIAGEAYVYGFPIVMNYKTMWNYAIDSESGNHPIGNSAVGK